MRRSWFGVIVLVATFAIHGCAGPSRLYPNPNGAPERSLRLVEIMALSSTFDVEQKRDIYEPLAAAGIDEARTRQRSIGVGRVYCCGGKRDETFFHYVYIPPGIPVAVGDIVEFKNGSLPKDGKSTVNTVVRVVQTKDDSSGTCRWEPPDRRYGRILYCDWMPRQGWVKQKFGIGESWVKLADP